jgi:hypothetical protein
MTRDHPAVIYTLLALGALWFLSSVIAWTDTLPAPKRIVSLADVQRQCPAYEPGRSRTLVILAREDDAGRIVEQVCIRTEARGKARVMSNGF